MDTVRFKVERKWRCKSGRREQSQEKGSRWKWTNAKATIKEGKGYASMNAKTWAACGFCLLCGLVIGRGCNGSSPKAVLNDSPANAVANDSPANAVAKASTAKMVKFRALIDGADTVKIQGKKIWYVHESWDLPGRWRQHDEPTMINDKPWRQVWHDKVSEPFEGLEPAFNPRSAADVKLTKLNGRGEAEISQPPTPENNQTLSIRFDDSSFSEADWYEVKIEWK
jgi:hypothetical protein